MLIKRRGGNVKQEKSYEEKIADIKKYLKEKEEEVAKNKVSEVRRNPIKKINDDILFENDKPNNDYLKFDDIKSDNNHFSKITDNNGKVEKTDNEIIKDEKKEIKNFESVEVDKKKNGKDEDTPSKKSKFNTLFILLLIISPLFISLSVISFHSTYLISEPFNYILYVLSG